MADDRWWRGFDTLILDAVAAGARVLDVGCGEGGLIDHLAVRGLDAVGVDPRAPARPRLIQERVEDLGAVRRFDAVCAVMSLHHADLESVVAAIARLLRPGGGLFVCELAWEAYDERAASWLAAHGRSDADNSVNAWQLEHRELHTGAAVRAALDDAFALRSETRRPYLARMLGAHELEDDEQAMIAAGALPALSRWYLAEAR